MTLERWDPFRELRRMDRLWRGFGIGREIERWAVPLGVVREGDDIVVRASVPGVKPEDIQVTVEEDLLTIKAETETEAEHEESNGNYLMRERRAGKFHRSLRLPDTVDAEKVESRYDHGVLTIRFPKVEAKKARRLEIKVGE